MLRTLRIKLKLTADNAKTRPQITGDALHGVLMEHISPEYADTLHISQLNPYSGHCRVSQSSDAVWIVSALTEEAGANIITPLLDPDFSGFFMRKTHTHAEITDKTLTEVSMKELLDRYYFTPAPPIYRVSFMTETAFKQAGEYVFMPDLRLLYGSLIRKYETVISDTDTDTDEILDELVRYSKIVRYDIKSRYCEIGRAKLPAFTGFIVIKTQLLPSLAGYLHFLLRFGVYAGAGIKCAMGMGAIEVS